MSKQKHEKLIIEGTALWAKLHKPSAPGDYKQMYEIDIVVDDETAKTLHAKGIKIGRAKNLESIPEELHGKPTVKAKSNYMKADGTTNGPIRTVDSTGKNKVTADVGNGSTVRVATTLVPYNRSGNTGIFVALNAVQVINLIEYSGGSDLFDAVDGGFVADTTVEETTETTNTTTTTDDMPF